jgi:hypothetical protein
VVPLITGESVTTVVCDRAVNAKRTRATKRVLPAIDLGILKNLFSEKTTVMG